MTSTKTTTTTAKVALSDRQKEELLEIAKQVGLKGEERKCARGYIPDYAIIFSIKASELRTMKEQQHLRDYLNAKNPSQEDITIYGEKYSIIRKLRDIAKGYATPWIESSNKPNEGHSILLSLRFSHYTTLNRFVKEYGLESLIDSKLS